MIVLLLFAFVALCVADGNQTVVCSTLPCANCTLSPSCAFCEASNACVDRNASAFTCNSTLCFGPKCSYICECDDDTYPCGVSIPSQLLLIAFYGAILGGSAKLISDGSELLLELFPAWGTVIGALLLPVLGAVPDSAIIIVSGLGDAASVQENIAVGVGTLAGSTIMLLTIAWAGAAYLGRCDLNEFGEAIDGRCTRFSALHQGVSVDSDTSINARIMLATSLLYFIVQVPSFMHETDPTSEAAKNAEHIPAYVGFSFCFAALLAYCVYQVIVPRLAQKRIAAANEKLAAKEKQIKAMNFVNKFPAFAVAAHGDGAVDLAAAHVEARALAIGKRWRRMALAEAATAEESPLLAGSIQHEEEESEDEVDPREHFWKNMFKSLALMLVGTGLVAVFSDPMVGAISNFGNTAGLKPFFVSFIITPFCSNASELLSSLIFAAKKKKENASMTYSQLYGAATMNNTLCLGIFFALIAFRGLTWSFSAETTAIVVVTWCVGLPAALKTNFAFIWMVPILLAYPLSLVLVSVLESSLAWQ